ncbi:MAG: hypothetical protein AAF282_04430 [Cyanobacteria bacterium P01_A01_bin.15]
MIWFIVTIALLYVLIGVGYVFGVRSTRGASGKAVTHLVPWVGFGIIFTVVFSAVANDEQFDGRFVYLVYGAGILFWLLSWPLRSRKAGGLLLNAGRTWHNKLLFWIGILEVGVAAVITWVSLVAISDLPDTPEPMAQLSKVLFWWTFAVFLLSVGLNRLELRENGMCFLYTFVPWRRMKAYTWETSAPNTLTVRIKPRLPLLSGYMSIRVPKSCRDDVDQVLQTHVPISDAS